MNFNLFNRKKFMGFYISLILIAPINCDFLELSDANFDKTILTYEVVFVNFHAEWCPFSSKLYPILKECNEVLSKEFPGPNRILIARVECDDNPILSTRYRIKKYPTLKTFINGRVLQNEYRGRRDREEMTQFIREMMSDPVVHIVYQKSDDMTEILYNRSAVIGYFKEAPHLHPKYEAFKKVGKDLRNYCQFYWVTNFPFLLEGQNEMLAFKSYRSTFQSEYDFMFENYDELSTWATHLCIPIVRELTFNNAEEIMEENLPLVILFHHSDDDDNLLMYKTIVEKELINQTSFVNFVSADGDLFEHPLTHINKSKKDLPLIALDTFEHMYLFPKFEDLNKTQILANFIEDMKSGKLHIQYHLGPDYRMDSDNSDDNNEEEDEEETVTSLPATTDSITIKDNSEEESVYETIMTPVGRSIFKNLKPSEYRYSLLRDEL